MLRRGEIFFASASELNDANECRPHLVFRGSSELWQRLADYILFQASIKIHHASGGRMELLSNIREISDDHGKALKGKVGNKDLGIHELGSVFTDTLHQISKGKLSPRDVQALARHSTSVIDGLPQQLREERYIASFARNATDPTMWGHYAGAEKGFLVVYETDNNKVQVHSPLNILHGSRSSDENEGVITLGAYSEEFLDLRPVEYKQSVPKVNAFHGLIPRFIYSEEEDRYDVPALIAGDAPEKHQDQIGLIKYSSWRYEREIRAFFPTYSLLPPDLRTLAVDANHIKGVVFGPRMSDIDKERAIFCCHLFKQECSKLGRNIPGEIAFYQAKHRADQFKLTITPFGVLDDRFFGRAPVTPLTKCPPEVAKRLVEIARAVEEGQ